MPIKKSQQKRKTANPKKLLAHAHTKKILKTLQQSTHQTNANITHHSETFSHFKYYFLSALGFLLGIDYASAGIPPTPSIQPTYSNSRLSSYFMNNRTRYFLETSSRIEFDDLVSSIQEGQCGAEAMPRQLINYDLIAGWPAPGDTSVEFFREHGRDAIEAFESCIKKLIEDTIKSIEKKLSNEEITIFSVLGIVAGALAITGILICHYNLYQRFRANESREARNHASAEEQQSLLEEGRHTSNNANRLFSPKQLTKEERETFKPKQLSFQERLNLIGVPADRIPSEFLDPITFAIMENPMVTDDGYTYDESTLNSLQKEEKPCPFDPSKKIKNNIENRLLKNMITEFVEKKEKEAKLLKEEPQTATKPINIKQKEKETKYRIARSF